MKISFIFIFSILVEYEYAALLPYKQNNVCTNVASYYFLQTSKNCYYNPDVLSNIYDIVPRHNYTLKHYQVITDDGYIINLYRIIKDSSANKPVVFILHGVVIDMESWIAFGNHSVAFSILEAGYDVWLGTFRGTRNSNEHVNLSNDIGSAYWDYNIDTIAANDVPKQLEFVYNTTSKKILYLGHSMGTTLIFMYASEFPEQADQYLAGIFAMAPVVYLNNVPFVEILTPIGFTLIDLFNSMDIKAILTHEQLLHSFLTTSCKTNSILYFIILSTASGFTTYYEPEMMLPFLSYWPAGVSIYVLEQYLQIAKSETFQKFDYSKETNLKKYGSETPPVYNLGNIKLPISMFYGANDVLFNQDNYDRLLSELRNNVGDFSIPLNTSKDNTFAHINFITARNIQEYLIDVVLEQFQKVLG